MADVYLEAETLEALAGALCTIKNGRLEVQYTDNVVSMGKKAVEAVEEVKPVLGKGGEVVQEAQEPMEAQPAKGDPKKFYALVRASDEDIAKVKATEAVKEVDASLGAEIVGVYL